MVANVAHNEHTGDAIRSKPPGSTYGDNYDNIFRKPKLELPGDESKGTPQIVMADASVTSNQPMDTTEEWDETRVDTIGQNGNEGLHYLH